MLIMRNENDWEVSSDGLFVATRGFLSRRGYCCANKCRNCPYINWRQRSDWQPIPAEQVKRARVSMKALIGAQEQLHYHEQQLQSCCSDEQKEHSQMIEHYQTLLAHWLPTR
ncbi:DUF5522 domain-containing protein [Tengunoibacter tsumagoiensis]|uniref:Uncharacterized protein n=1 Tax=Tengunoibacter tsumagoiensis TaxID=2014871 RepID=A0A401ZWV7_9CHLR|nr:DUF5522 domain-containing protein [Tengunoibacter tsumagoiensis]GCE11411.1 hypothetical protein KTT_12700 [Tengunoibacter tsumagoiensis]